METIVMHCPELVDLHSSYIENAQVRDQFAMAALTGMVDNTVDLTMTTVIAEAAYKYADAMMKARNVFPKEK